MKANVLFFEHERGEEFLHNPRRRLQAPQNCSREKQNPGQRTDRVEYIRRFLSVEIEAI